MVWGGGNASLWQWEEVILTPHTQREILKKKNGTKKHAEVEIYQVRVSDPMGIIIQCLETMAQALNSSSNTSQNKPYSKNAMNDLTENLSC